MAGRQMSGVGAFILRHIYGEKEYTKRWIENEDALTIKTQKALTLGVVFWLICILILLCGVANKDTLVCLVFVVGFPVALIIWSICVRRRAENDWEGNMDE